jgi:NADH:ubiquinone oxidoreductase subunit 4 (subunit M)
VDPLLFYIFFELRILPAFFLILSWGNAPERLGALMYIIVYTLMGSFPLLFSLLLSFKDVRKIQKILNFQNLKGGEKSLVC